MNNIAGIPYSSATFDKAGHPLSVPSVSAGTTDLVFVVHGECNDIAGAEALYSELFRNVAKTMAMDSAFQARKLAIIGVLWPSKKLDQLISFSGAPQRGAAVETAEMAEMAMREALDRVSPLFDGSASELARARALVPELEFDEEAQIEFVNVLRRMLDVDRHHSSIGHSEDSSDIFFEGYPPAIFQKAARLPPGGHVSPTGPSLGYSHASKALNAVLNLLNLAMYLELKRRADDVGQIGLAPLIDSLRARVARIHLVGHSFGGRIATAAVAQSTTDRICSLILFQAAFSHHAFSRRRGGYFRTVVDHRRVSGPIVITHSKNHRSARFGQLVYSAASRISGDQAMAFGDAEDEFGEIGANGAQAMESGEIASSSSELLPVGGHYYLQAGKFHNLNSDAFAVDSRGDNVKGLTSLPEVAWAINRAIIAS